MCYLKLLLENQFLGMAHFWKYKLLFGLLICGHLNFGHLNFRQFQKNILDEILFKFLLFLPLFLQLYLNLTAVIKKNWSFSYPFQTKFQPKSSVIELLAMSLVENKEETRIHLSKNNARGPAKIF